MLDRNEKLKNRGERVVEYIDRIIRRLTKEEWTPTFTIQKFSGESYWFNFHVLNNEFIQVFELWFEESNIYNIGYVFKRIILELRKHNAI